MERGRGGAEPAAEGYTYGIGMNPTVTTALPPLTLLYVLLHAHHAHLGRGTSRRHDTALQTTRLPSLGKNVEVLCHNPPPCLPLRRLHQRWIVSVHSSEDD